MEIGFKENSIQTHKSCGWNKSCRVWRFTCIGMCESLKPTMFRYNWEKVSWTVICGWAKWRKHFQIYSSIETDSSFSHSFGFDLLYLIEILELLPKQTTAFLRKWKKGVSTLLAETKLIDIFPLDWQYLMLEWFKLRVNCK